MIRDLIQMFVEMPAAPDMLLKATLVLSLGWVLHFALARSNPRWRVLLWRSVIVGVLLVPLLGTVMPALKLTVPNRPIEAAWGSDDSNRGPRIENEPPLVPGSQSAPVIIAPPTMPQESIFSTLKRHPWILLSILWAGVSLGLATKLLISLGRVRRLFLASTPVDGNIQKVFDDLRGTLGITRAIDLRVSRGLSSPFLYGFRQPVILLPGRMTQDDYAKELPAIFAHELAHLAGRDLAWMTVIHLVTIVLWFHPLAWRLREAHAVACEAVCDASAALHVGNALSYSRTLARIALEVVAMPPAVGGIAMARLPEVRRRLEILKRKINIRPLGRQWVMMALVVGFAALSAITGVRLVGAATTTTLEKRPARTLHFPETSIGRVFTVADDERASFPYPTKRSDPLHFLDYVSAKGEVTIPAGKDVELSVDAGDAAHLKNLAPDDVQILSVSHINESDILQLSRMTGLLSLSLSMDHVTTASLGSLRQLPRLESLHIDCGQSLDREACAQLKRFSSLKSFSLSNAVVSNHRNTRLSADEIAALREMPSLEQIILYGDGPDDELLARLADLPRLYSIHYVIDPKDWKSHITDTGLKHLSKSNGLKYLYLYGAEITNQGLSYLAGMKQIERLGLAGTLINDQGLGSLKDLSGLKSLQLGASRGGRISDEGVAQIVQAHGLEELELGDTEISDRGVALIAQNLPHLGFLALDGTNITDAGLAQLANLRSLRVLSITYMKKPLSKEAIQRLQTQNPKLQIVDTATMMERRKKKLAEE